MPDIEDVAISSDVIRLGQLEKFVGVADSGAHAGSLIAAGDVRVNDEVELRRGRQLVRDDVVDVAVPSGTVTFRIS